VRKRTSLPVLFRQLFRVGFWFKYRPHSRQSCPYQAGHLAAAHATITGCHDRFDDHSVNGILHIASATSDGPAEP
jgi:hypothetical protein